MKEIQTEEKEFMFLKAKAGTNTPTGGNKGITRFTLTDKGMTNWKIETDGDKKEQPKEITIELYGDIEADDFIKALKFAIDTYKDQRSKKKS